MTVVGKILVFLNLVFSLAVGWFAVMDYTARTHWKDGFDKVKAQNDVLRSAADTYRKDSDQLAKEKADLYEQLNAQRVKWDDAAKDDKEGMGRRVAERTLAVLTDRAKTIEELKSQVDDLRKQLAAEKAQVVKYTAAERAYSADTTRRQDDTKIMRETLKVEMDKNLKLTETMNALRDEKITSEIGERTVRARNTELEKQLQDMARSLAKVKSTGAAAGVAGVNPPPENIEGLVRRAEGGLVTISLGSDAGLTKGQTMEIFRLGQNARYIGRVRIVEVTPTQAVGQVQGRLTMPIQVGDRVASRIMGGY